MGVFDLRRKRRPPQVAGSRGALDEYKDLQSEVPNIDDVVGKLDGAIAEQNKIWNRQCGCWE